MDRMDNILKLLLGVLGVAGLLAMLAPSGFAPPEPEATATEAPPPAEQASADPIPQETAPTESQEYNFKIGEPTIDGKPIIDPNSPSPTADNNETQTQSPPVPNSNGEYATLAQPSYAAPQSGGGEIPVPTP